MPVAPPKDAKSVLRDAIRLERKCMLPAEVEASSQKIQNHLMRWLSGKQFGAVAAYLAVRNEAVIHPAMEQDQNHDRRWYFPRVLPEKMMEFVAWRSYEPLRKGKFGIKEPADGQRLDFQSRDVLILLPSVAIDRRGNRLGSGAGYYDRFLRTLPDLSRVTLMGVCWERFVLPENIPVESYDVAVHAVLTEKGVTEFAKPT